MRESCQYLGKEVWASATGLSGEEAFQQSVLRCKGPEGRKSTETQVAAAGERGGGGGGGL